MTIDTQRLRELLAKATPGPWSAIGSAGYVQAGEGHPRHNILAVAYGHDGDHQINAPGARENGEYIAAANPATMAALLDELERKDAEVKHLREAFEQANEALARIGDFAHDKSTGPAVPDALWEVRSMAYDAVRIPGGQDYPAALNPTTSEGA